MVDNFCQISKLLHFENPGDCYWIQLLRRSNDDPSGFGKTNPKYHGKASKRTIASYFITSVNNFESLKEDIVKICDALNCRAYILLDKRNFEKMTKLMLVNISEKIASNCFCSPAKIAFSTAGIENSAKEKTWIVDIDKEYVPYVDGIKAAICNSSEFSEPIIAEIKTKNGCHLITKKFNKKRFSECWVTYHDNRANFGYTVGDIPLNPPEIKSNSPTILYVPGE